MEELVLIARIRRPHGLKGELLLQSLTSDENRFKKLKTVLLRNLAGDVIEKTIAASRNTQQGVLITFEGIADRTAAEELQGMEVMIPLKDRAPLKEGQVYQDQLLELIVVDDTTSEKLGVVRDVLEMPAGDVLVIDLENGEEHLLTMRGEEIKKIDLKKNELRVVLLAEFDGRSSGEKI